MDSAGAALIITVLAGIAVILAAVIIAARREQRRNEDQIARVRGVIGRVSPIDMSVNGDQQVPTRRGGSTGRWVDHRRRAGPKPHAGCRGTDRSQIRNSADPLCQRAAPEHHLLLLLLGCRGLSASPCSLLA